MLPVPPVQCAALKKGIQTMSYASNRTFFFFSQVEECDQNGMRMDWKLSNVGLSSLDLSLIVATQQYVPIKEQ